MAKKTMYGAYKAVWSGSITSKNQVTMSKSYQVFSTTQSGNNYFVCSPNTSRPTIKGNTAIFPANSLYIHAGFYFKIASEIRLTATRLPDSETPYTFTKGKCTITAGISGGKRYAKLTSFAIDVFNVFSWEVEVPDLPDKGGESGGGGGDGGGESGGGTDPVTPTPDPENPDPVTPDPTTPSVDVDYNFKERDMLIRANNEYVSVARIKVLDGSIVVTTNDNQTITLTTKKPTSEIHSLIFRALRMSPALLNLDGIA